VTGFHFKNIVQHVKCAAGNQERINQEAEDKKRAASANKDSGMDAPKKPVRRDDFPELKVGCPASSDGVQFHHVLYIWPALC
jgi:hypothetical protein